MQHSDNIVIGAVSAGCVVANRLTEEPAISHSLMLRGYQPARGMSGLGTAQCRPS